MGVARKPLIEAGLSACRERLEAMGFTRHGANIFTLPFGPRLFGWVGLGQGVHRGDGSMDVTPWVGLLHQDVERLVATCANLPYHRYYPATLQMNVGLLTPEATSLQVIFHPQDSVEEPADQVCLPIRDYGIPWMRKHSSLAAIYALLNSGQFNNSALYTFKPPVVAWMLGCPDLAHQHIQDNLKRLAQEEGPNRAGALEVYRRFATALEELMSQAPSIPRCDKQP